MSTLRYNKKQLIDILEHYYKEYEQRPTKISITTKMESIGYGMSEGVGAVTTVKAARKLMTVGVEAAYEEILSEETVEEILKTVLEKEGINVTSFTFEDGATDRTTGYGMGERTEHVPYFNGISIRIDKPKEKIYRR